jgi:transglutaminase-like putative cysteine protease
LATTARTEVAPEVTETRYYRVLQTVELTDLPEGAQRVKFWVAVPGDGPWQRVLERRVVDAPPGWELVRVPESGGEMIFVDLPATTAAKAPLKVRVETLVRRDAPAVDLSAPSSAEELGRPFQRELFASALRADATNMMVDEKVRTLAGKACEGEQDPRRKVVRLLQATADVADHYSKDPSKPHCGRGSAQDCMENGGGCCTDLHSLFIALARAEGIPARLQMGYRLRPDREGTSYDPSYRCWVEYWLEGSGWVPTDIVVADSGEPDARASHWGKLDARRVWLWEGRGFNLAPAQGSPPIQTMHSGWAEIDGVAVDVLPAADGTPSKLRRSITFHDLTEEFGALEQ